MCSLGIFFGAKERVVYNEGEDFFSLTEEHKNRFSLIAESFYLTQKSQNPQTWCIALLATYYPSPLTTHLSSRLFVPRRRSFICIFTTLSFRYLHSLQKKIK